MPVIAKIFMSGRSQAVRLPKEFHFDSLTRQTLINKPTVVILRESAYQHIVQATSRKRNYDDAHWIMNYKPADSRSKEEIDRQIANERNSWDLV